MARILVVDDDADSREVVCGYFSKAGHSVVSAASGREALEVLESTESGLPDVILLDIRMPGMDGIGVLNVMSSYLRWATIPVGILTAYPEDPRLWHVGDKGVERIFAKSRVSLAEVLAWVERRTSGGPQLSQEPPAPHLGA